MNDESMKTLISLVEELATLRAQKKAVLRIVEADKYVDRNTILRIYDEEVKNDL